MYEENYDRAETTIVHAVSLKGEARPSEITLQMQILMKTISSLEETVSEVNGAFAPVLHPEREEPNGLSQEKEMSTNTEIGGAIMNARMRVQTAKSALRSIIDRREL